MGQNETAFSPQGTSWFLKQSPLFHLRLRLGVPSSAPAGHLCLSSHKRKDNAKKQVAKDGTGVLTVKPRKDSPGDTAK